MTAPVNSVAPAISALPTPIALGAVLTTDDGTWDTGTFTVQWLRDGAVIVGQTVHTKTVVQADLGTTITSRITAIGAAPSDVATADSNALGPVPGTLVVEDGSNVANAEAYCTVAYADSYHDSRGHTTWSVTSLGDKEAALRTATDFMTQRFRLRWLGNRVFTTQVLDWPRYNVPIPDSPGGYRGFPLMVAFNIVPDQVKRACSELALRVTQGFTLNPDLQELVHSKKVGPIEVVYEHGSQGKIEFSSIDMLLTPLLNPGSYYKVRRA